MTKKKARKIPKKEEIAEDWCFVCKDGGLLLLMTHYVERRKNPCGKVDFKDWETYEGLFMEYWASINEKEGLTVKNLQSAKVRLKTGNNYKSDSDSNKADSSEEDQLISDSDNMDYIEEQKPERKRKKRSFGQSSPGKRKYKSNKQEFIGWGSKSLIKFISSIGKDTSRKLSQHDVTSIINGYIKENNLFHPEKKKQVVCDARLQSVLGRKIVNKHRIFNLLETHFAENLDSSSEEDVGYNSEEMDADTLVACKRQRKSSTDIVSQKKEVVLNIPENCLASLVTENIKLIYLKRSLVVELLQQPETFDSKVLGSFVRVKSDPNDFFQKNPYQLVQVTDSFSCCQEECEDLRLKVKLGLLKKITVVSTLEVKIQGCRDDQITNELEQKARSLHEDLTKHWIARELLLLQNLIDRANEKGWRREYPFVL
ncbi:hypothetical protein LguiB_006625 [Lonicera macranthoides]